MIETLAPLATFESLNERHVALLEALADERLDARAAHDLIDDAAAAGAQIESVSNRDAVRSMISYWTATLARLPAEPAEPAPLGSVAAPLAGVAPAAAPIPTPVRPTLATFDPAQCPDLPESANPFVGLAPFDADQAHNFFGRGKAVQDLLRLVLASPLVVVTGGSGTGKSSLVRAGLVNALAQNPETEAWRVVLSTPGRDPIASLALALTPLGAPTGWAEGARTRLEQEPAAAAALVEARPGLALIIDQTEELFSLAPPEQRDRAARAIAALAAAPGVRVVLTMRDEYLEGERSRRVLPNLDLAAASEFHVPPLDPAEIRAAIVDPAAHAGLVFQDGLVDRMIAEVGSDPAALPLLQYALLRLWKARQGNRITAEAYERVGGPARALPNAAQAVFDNLGGGSARDNARIIFQQLVRPSLVYEFVRDRVTRGELERLLPPQSIDTVLRPFANAGLLRITPGSERGEDRIEILHEALIRNWEPLRRWASEVRERERTFLALDAQAQRWGASQHAAGHLLFGRALKDAEAARDAYRRRARVDPVLDTRVTAFLQASRATQRRFITIAAAVAGLIAILIATAILLDQSRNAKEESLLNSQAEVADTRDNLHELSESTGSISERNVYLEGRTSAAVTRAEVARQLIQMWLSRGTVRADELPPTYADMAPVAAPFPVKPWQAAFERQALNGYPPVPLAPRVPGLAQLNLPNARLFYDTARALPIYAVLLTQRTDAPVRVRPNALYSWPGLDGQPDPAELARRGIALGRLFDGRDIAWGDDSQHALLAANLVAAMVPIEPAGPSARSFADWFKIGMWMRVNHNPAAARVAYLTGAVPDRGASAGSPPARLWVIAASYAANGRIVTDAATLPPVSDSGVSADDLPGRTTVAAIARLTGFGLPLLRAAARASREKAGQLTAVRPAELKQAAPVPSPLPPALTGSAPVAGARSSDMDPARPGTAEPAHASDGVVFVQAVGLRPAQEKAVLRALSSAGFRLRPIDRNVPCVSSPQVRYSDPGDAAQAARAAGVAGAAMREAGLGHQSVGIRRLDLQRYRKARAGVLELWLCGAAAS